MPGWLHCSELLRGRRHTRPKQRRRKTVFSTEISADSKQARRERKRQWHRPATGQGTLDPIRSAERVIVTLHAFEFGITRAQDVRRLACEQLAWRRERYEDRISKPLRARPRRWRRRLPRRDAPLCCGSSPRCLGRPPRFAGHVEKQIMTIKKGNRFLTS